jgi:hypothetical protein
VEIANEELRRFYMPIIIKNQEKVKIIKGNYMVTRPNFLEIVCFQLGLNYNAYEN